MDSSEDRRLALLSIHPRYADAILAGDKAVEFRKRPFAQPVDQVVIYSTSPVQRVVGTFDVDDVDVATPDQLWDRYGQVGGISRDDFDDYYADTEQGAAIRIRAVTRLNSPVPLDVLGDVRPPQNFAYLDDDARQLLTALTRDPRPGPAARPSQSGGLLADLVGLLAAIPGRLLDRVRGRATTIGT